MTWSRYLRAVSPEPPPDELTQLRDAYARAQTGDYRAAEALLAAEGGATDAARAWRAALQAVLWVAAPELGPPATPADGAHDARAIVLAQRVRAELLAHRFEWPEGPEGDDGLAELLAEEHRGLVELARGDATLAHARFEALRRRAREPSSVVDAAAWSAFAALATGDVEEALGRARRASRMARTESLLSCEYLASAVLARARRHAGAPHLAARIAGQLLDVVPSTWRPWVTYELALAGGSPADHAGSPSLALAALFDAARSGERAAFADARARYEARLEGFAPLAAEARAIADALDPEADATSAFARGAETLSPHGVVDPREGDGAVAFVLCRPGRPARRVLAAGRALLDVAAWEPGDAAANEHRSLTLLAALAFAPAMELEAAFAAVYGFAFTTAKHDAVMRTLLHRTRVTLDAAGTIEREGTTLRLVPSAPLLIPDPRCARPADQRVLAALAIGGGAVGAKDLARSLRVPLRTVQLALKRLVEDGAARSHKDGRRVAYVVEDSAFCEPTLSRLARRPSLPG